MLHAEGYAFPVRNRDDDRDDDREAAAEITRDEARAWFTRFLLRRVRRDDYPSTTQLDLIEKSLPREMLPQYLRVLVDKVAHDTFPSIPLLRRIQRLIEHLPRSGHRPQPRRKDHDDGASAHNQQSRVPAPEDDPATADQPRP
jgi:hypothetical protein